MKKTKRSPLMMAAIFSAIAAAVSVPLDKVNQQPAERQITGSKEKQGNTGPVEQARHANFVASARRRRMKIKNRGSGAYGNRGKPVEVQRDIFIAAHNCRRDKSIRRITAAIKRDFYYYRTKQEHNAKCNQAFYFPLPDNIKIG